MKVARDLTLGQYHPGASTVHRLDPRVKLVVCLAAMLCVFVPAGGWRGLACTWPLLGLGFATAGIPAGSLVLGLRPFRWFFAGIVALHALTTSGRALGGVSWVAVWPTVEGLNRGAWVSAQLATAIGFSSLLTLTTDPVDLLRGVERLAAPLVRLGVPVDEFCFTLLLALRIFPSLSVEAGRLLATRRAGVGPLERARALPEMLAALFRGVIGETEETARALLSKRPGPAVHRLGLGEVLTLGAAVATATAVGWVTWKAAA